MFVERLQINDQRPIDRKQRVVSKRTDRDVNHDGPRTRSLIPLRSAEFDHFAQSVSPQLLRLAVARTGSLSDAEDLVQEVLIEAHRRWPTISTYDDPASWARRVVLNMSVSRGRRKSSERSALGRLRTSPQQPHNSELSERPLGDEVLWTAIRALPERQRNVVLLLWFEDLSVASTAAVLECGEETVRTHWRRARSTLAKRLNEVDDMEDR